MDGNAQGNKRSPKAAPLDEGLLATPEPVLQAIGADSLKAGGEWKPDPAAEGSIGRTMFDTPSSKDGTITVLLPPQYIDALPSQALVRIESRQDKRTYLGAVVEGPFAEPDGLRADAVPMVVSAVQGALLMPKHHGRVQVSLIGERVEDDAIIPPRYRPKPNSPVFALDAEETAEVLRVRGNLRIGLADGFDDLIVRVPADSKSVFPRHTGILGTTGGGKSTTVSGTVYRMQKENVAVILIDTEGEYCAIHEPTTDPQMIQALKRRGLTAEGVTNTHVYHLVGRESANPDHPSRTVFSLRFCDLSPFAVAEILDLNDAQQQRFMSAYDVTKHVLEQFKMWPRTSDERAQLMELDELETGYPSMTLEHLYDVIKQFTALVSKDEDEPFLRTKEFFNRRAELKELITRAKPEHKSSWRALLGKFGKIYRLGIFDATEAGPLAFGEMLQPERVSILDLSDTDSPQVNNLVIAQLLRGIQEQQERNYKAAVENGRQPTPAVIFIEEAHEFLSAQRIKQMPVLFEQVARIARRGRKRWLGLVFITQLPQQLPDEVLGLINNWILHKIGDSNVITRLRRSIGGIDESLWERVPSLAPGQALVSFTSLTRPLQVSIDPTPCKLLMAE